MIEYERNSSPSGLGLKIIGMDLKNEIDPDILSQLRSLWVEYSILIFSDQKLSHLEFEKFSLNFGEYGDDPYIDSIEGHPHIIEVRKEANEKATHFGGSWHSDWSFQKRPPSATLLHSKIIPPVGGDTLFANTIRAYEDLSQELKSELKDLKINHSASLPYADDGFYALEKEKDRSMKIVPSKEAKKTYTHPLVRTHAETRKKGLFINPVYSLGILDMPENESKRLLDYLYSHMIQEKYIFRHKWQENMLIMWDNRSVMHQAEGGYEGYKRLLHRITIAGERPS
ncbi:MAG: TauD/TfdA family dioxygenase [Pseudomonadota bacterium]|nr:TauD/TfdA family dioxygenase [Pseudomonadota bacterium]